MQYLTNNVCKSLNKSSAITLKSSCIKQMKHSNDHITGISTLSIERTWVGMTCFKRKKRKELLNYYGIFCCSISNILKYHNFSCLSQIKFIHCLTTVSLLCLGRDQWSIFPRAGCFPCLLYKLILEPHEKICGK